ncbi:MAG: TldD/PmbA family protein [Proteobacteria bacterium]|nr:TldD/PmbA family protein [Pseudomonadota bacterium]
MSNLDNTFNLLDDLIKQTLKAGCDAAEAVFVSHDGVSASVRHGRLEHIERPSGTALGLRAFCGKRQTSLSTSDLSGKALKKLVTEAVQIAKVSPEDPYCGLIEGDELASNSHNDLEIFDSAQPPADDLKEIALRAEAAALEEKAITNSEGAGAGWSKKTKYFLTSKGFRGSYSSSSFSLSAVVIAGQGARMERDYEYSTTRFLADLKTPEEIGRKAAERTVKRLNPKKIKTGPVPVIFSRRVSASLLGHFSGAINGQAIARGTSFLKDAMEGQVFSRGIRIIDDPLRKRGLASRPFDAEGVAAEPLAIVRDGILQSWLLDAPSARELKLKTTGHAARGLASPPYPAPTNFYMENGTLSVPEMLKDIGSVFLVTELIGMGVNLVTGDYSRGATGFWIEGGEIAYAVNEVTIAGNLKDMFLNLTPAGDLEFKNAINAPTVLLGEMMVAGA